MALHVTPARLSSTSDSKESSGTSPELDDLSSESTNECTNEIPASNIPVQGVLERYHNLEKSPADKHTYRGLLLTNRLKVVLASNPAADTSAAALEVQVGYYSDPDEIPGLAHFCEHMLFLGTEKYPKENEYKKIISEHGGSCNAFTCTDRTVYHFETTPPHLNKTLDMFAQFFISPLFIESATNRELNAVHSEYENQLSSDGWRLFELEKCISDPKHPFNKFGTGSKETLQIIPENKGIDIRNELLKFHEKWYSSNIMSLVVVGKESLDELEAMVAPLFSTIKDKSVTAPSWPLNPIPLELRRKKIYGLPIKDTRDLTIKFAIPYTKKYYKARATNYLANVIGHEGPGSILSALKRRGWCNILNSNAVSHGRGFQFYCIEADLTEEGIKYTDDIISLIFQYIAMLKIEGPQRWIWDEQKHLRELYFRFKDVTESGYLAENLVQRLEFYPMEEVLTENYLHTEWKPELITEILSLLTPENVVVTINAKAFEDKCTMTDRWYETKYGYEDIDENTLKKWKEVQLTKEFFLPPPNEYIPSTLAMEITDDPICKDIAPAIVKDTKLMRLWYKKDNEFLEPKAMITFDLVSPLAYPDPFHSNLNDMLVGLVSDGLRELTYAANLAGLDWSMSRNPEYGINIDVNGYDEKIHLLLDKIVDHLVTYKTDPKRFYIIRENHVRSLKNWAADQPSDLAMDETNLCLSGAYWTAEQLLKTAQDITPEQLDEFTAKFIRRVHIEGLMHGNLSKERAIKIADSIEAKFPKDGIPLYAQQLLLNRDIELDKGTWYVRQINANVHRPSCAALYYACGVQELRQHMILHLLSNILEEPCFSTLRTKEQLGYIVCSRLYCFNGAHGLMIYIQSDRHPKFLEQRIETFVQSFLEFLQNLSDEELTKYREGLVATMQLKPKQISTMANRMWREITTQVYNFDRTRLQVEQLNTITKDDLIQFYKKYFHEDSNDRAKLSVYVISTAEGGAGAEDSKETQQEEENLNKESHKEPEMITDLLEFKSRRRLYPHPIPMGNIPRKGL